MSPVDVPWGVWSNWVLGLLQFHRTQRTTLTMETKRTSSFHAGAVALAAAIIAGSCAGVMVGGLFSWLEISTASIGTVAYRVSVGLVVAVDLATAVVVFRLVRRRLMAGEARRESG